jgi:hypothetical protein
MAPAEREVGRRRGVVVVVVVVKGVEGRGARVRGRRGRWVSLFTTQATW